MVGLFGCLVRPSLVPRLVNSSISRSKTNASGSKGRIRRAADRSHPAEPFADKAEVTGWTKMMPARNVCGPQVWRWPPQVWGRLRDPLSCPGQRGGFTHFFSVRKAKTAEERVKRPIEENSELPRVPTLIERHRRTSARPTRFRHRKRTERLRGARDRLARRPDGVGSRVCVGRSGQSGRHN